MGVRKHTIEEMRELARKKGGECLSDEYVNMFTKLLWRCSEGHTFSSRPEHVLRGQWCPHCAGNARHTIDEMRELAASHGGTCLSDDYVNSSTKLVWRCSEGHVFHNALKNIRKEQWCPVCARRFDFTIEEMRLMAAEHFGECLSSEYVNSRQRLSCRCSELHEFEITPRQLSRGRWCPECDPSTHRRYTIENMK